MGKLLSSDEYYQCPKCGATYSGTDVKRALYHVMDVCHVDMEIVSKIKQSKGEK